MKRIVCLLLLPLLLVACTSEDLQLIMSIVIAAETVIPLIPELQTGQVAIVTAYVNAALVITSDLLLKPSDPAAIQKALADFNKLVVPQIANLNPKVAQALYALSIAIGVFVTNYSQNAQVAAARNGRAPKVFVLTTKDQKKALEILDRIKRDQDKLTAVSKH